MQPSRLHHRSTRRLGRLRAPFATSGSAGTAPRPASSRGRTAVACVRREGMRRDGARWSETEGQQSHSWCGVGPHLPRPGAGPSLRHAACNRPPPPPPPSPLPPPLPPHYPWTAPPVWRESVTGRCRCGRGLGERRRRYLVTRARQERQALVLLQCPAAAARLLTAARLGCGMVARRGTLRAWTQASAAFSVLRP